MGGKGTEIDDVMYIRNDEIVFLSHGESFKQANHAKTAGKPISSDDISSKKKEKRNNLW